MIRTYNKQTVVVENGVTKYLADIFCNSTDPKPTANLVNGSKLTEVDTGKTFLYDEGGSEWVEYSAGGGGGGNVLVELSNPTPVSQNPIIVNATSSLTPDEIYSLMMEGKTVIVNADLSQASMLIGNMQIRIDRVYNNNNSETYFNAFGRIITSIGITGEITEDWTVLIQRDKTVILTQHVYS